MTISPCFGLDSGQTLARPEFSSLQHAASHPQGEVMDKTPKSGEVRQQPGRVIDSSRLQCEFLYGRSRRTQGNVSGNAVLRLWHGLSLETRRALKPTCLHVRVVCIYTALKRVRGRLQLRGRGKATEDNGQMGSNRSLGADCRTPGGL